MSEEERLSDLDRRSLRILARSSKTAPSGDRLSERLERAAKTGDRVDYEKAERTFDSLPPEERSRIGHTAERQAETERSLLLSRKRVGQAGSETAPASDAAPARPLSPAKQDRDAPLDWMPIFASPEPTAAEPTGDSPSPPARVSVPAKAHDSGRPGTGRAATVDPQPADLLPIIVEDEADAAADTADDGNATWNWRDIPADPALNGGRGKNAGPVDPIAELRREMLGLDAKYGKG